MAFEKYASWAVVSMFIMFIMISFLLLFTVDAQRKTNEQLQDQIDRLETDLHEAQKKNASWKVKSVFS